MTKELSRFLKILSDCAAMDYPRVYYKDKLRTAKFWSEPFEMFAGEKGVDFAVDQPERTVWSLCTCYYANMADSLNGHKLRKVLEKIADPNTANPRRLAREVLHNV